MMFEKKDQIIVSSHTGRDVVDVKYFYRYIIPTGLNVIKVDILFKKIPKVNDFIEMNYSIYLYYFYFCCIDANTTLFQRKIKIEY